MTYHPGIKLSHIVREAILSVLRFQNGNRSAAARDLGISVRTIQNKIALYKSQGYAIPGPPAIGFGIQHSDPPMIAKDGARISDMDEDCP